ncbi:hypothetical protein WBJ53_04205 [Spirosoma sp. SC4-14]|uniref:hypothetical protein n=1 Tax=Spirosoma sp. SC4-14 TaxID=3128900 RepID=UPI0030CCAB49
MSSTIIRIWYILAVVAGITFGCGSKDPAPIVTYRVIRASETALDFEVSMLYAYDSLGRLKSVKEYNSIADDLSTVTPSAQTTVYYSAKTPNQIDYVDRRLTQSVNDASGAVVGSRRIFNYDSQGRLSYISESKAVGDFNTLKFVQSFQYDYGADNLPVTLIVSGPPPLLERDIYSYTFVNGNAVHIKLSLTTSKSSTPNVSESDVQFDDAPGVYTNFFAIYPGITSFNKNNVINANTTMVHDERGLLVKRVKKGNYIDDVTVYTYEAY